MDPGVYTKINWRNAAFISAGQEPDCFKISQNAAVPCKSRSLRPCVKKRKKTSRCCRMPWFSSEFLSASSTVSLLSQPTQNTL